LTHIGGIDLGILAVYLAAVVWLGFRALAQRKRGSEDYILASRSLTLPAFVATLVPSFFGGTLGVGEYAYRYGISNWLVQGVPYYVFALLYAWLLAPRIRKSSGLTIPDHIEGIFGKKTAVFAAFLVFLLASPADEVLMLGTLTHWISGWPLTVAVIIVTATAIGFLFAGGLRADVFANKLEFLFMFGGFALILPFAYMGVGGFSGLADKLPATHLTATGGNSWMYVLTWFFIALWTFVDPAFHQRVCAAEDDRTARRGIVISVGFWCLFDFMTTTAGLSARALMPDLAQPLTAYPALADRLLPPVVKGLFLAGVASSTLAALGTTSFLAAVSLGRDMAGRLLNIPASAEEKWIRRGLFATSLLSIVIALQLPSVVDIWYTVGSCVIPGLLLPMLCVYFPRLRGRMVNALPCSVAGFLGALGAWWIGSPVPFYYGLMASTAAWLLSGGARQTTPAAKPH
jgi:SSS family solute:Na+ symporter